MGTRADVDAIGDLGGVGNCCGGVNSTWEYCESEGVRSASTSSSKTRSLNGDGRLLWVASGESTSSRSSPLGIANARSSAARFRSSFSRKE